MPELLTESELAAIARQEASLIRYHRVADAAYAEFVAAGKTKAAGIIFKATVDVAYRADWPDTRRGVDA